MISPTIEAGDDLPLTLPRLLRRQAERFGERVMLVCDDDRMTYAQAEKRSSLIARGLIAAGAGKGSHVGILFTNGSDYVACAFAAARIGAVIVPISTFSTAEEVGWLLANADVGYLLTTPSFRAHEYAKVLRTAIPDLDFTKPPPLRSSAAPAMRRVWFGDPTPAGVDARWTLADLEASASSVNESMLEAIEARVTPAERLVILHTSGSTSTPKGVIHTHGALIRHINNLNQIRKLTPDEVLFSNSPWFWVAGFAYTLLGTLLAGCRVLCSNAVSASDQLDLLEREKPTYTNGYAQSVARLAQDPSFPKRDLSSIRRGNLYPIMPPATRPKDPELRHGNYGMTECGGTLTTHEYEWDLPEKYRGSFGTFSPGFEGKIVDPDTGRECATGEIGELWFRSPLMMEGYYGKPRSQVFDADGWFHCGDLGYLDEERFFHFKGRRGDMIKTLGANVSPREVEAALRPLIGERNCLALGVPDPERGQLVVALVIADSDDGVNEEALRKQLAAKLSSYKVPRRILRIAQSEIPLMSSGKTDMKRLVPMVVERMKA